LILDSYKEVYIFVKFYYVMTSKVTYGDIISLLPEYLMAFTFLLQSTYVWLQ